MALDFTGFISDNWAADAQTKQSFLDDFCAQYGYQEQIEDAEGDLIDNPASKTDFANEKIQDFIVQTVNAYRLSEAKKAATYDELSLE